MSIDKYKQYQTIEEENKQAIKKQLRDNKALLEIEGEAFVIVTYLH